MSPLISEQSVVSTAFADGYGYLSTGSKRNRLTISNSNLQNLADNLGISKESINSIFSILKKVENDHTEVVRFSKFGKESFFSGYFSGEFDDPTGNYQEKTRIIYLNNGSKIIQYRSEYIQDPIDLILFQDETATEQDEDDGEISINAGTLDDPSDIIIDGNDPNINISGGTI